MRQITREVCGAFMSGRAMRKSNTVTDGTSLWLFGNKIAEWRNGALCITNCGWTSNTTKERLNGLHGVHITQRNFEWYLNGTLWDGSWVQVSQHGASVFEDTTPTAELITIPSGAVFGADELGADEFDNLLERFCSKGIQCNVVQDGTTLYAVVKADKLSQAKEIVSEHFCSVDTEYLFSC